MNIKQEQAVQATVNLFSVVVATNNTAAPREQLERTLRHGYIVPTVLSDKGMAAIESVVGLS